MRRISAPEGYQSLSLFVLRLNGEFVAPEGLAPDFETHWDQEAQTWRLSTANNLTFNDTITHVDKLAFTNERSIVVVNTWEAGWRLDHIHIETER